MTRRFALPLLVSLSLHLGIFYWPVTDVRVSQNARLAVRLLRAPVPTVLPTAEKSPLLDEKESLPANPEMSAKPSAVSQDPPVTYLPGQLVQDIDPVIFMEGVENAFRERGQIRARLFVDEFGKVNAIEFADTGLNPLEREQLQLRFAEIRFEPALQEGIAVPSQLEVEISLQPFDTGLTAD